MGLINLVKNMEAGAGPLLVVVVAYGIEAPEGFEQLGRDALLLRLDTLRARARDRNQPSVLCLHVPRDTVPPVAALRAADVVLDLKKLRAR